VISVIQLGEIDYATGLRLQTKLVELRKNGEVGDVLLLLQHSPVITLGRNAKAANILGAPELLAQRGVEVYECDRGGDVTFHGPGQLVGYPIFDLRGDLRAALTEASAAEVSSGERGGPKTLGAVDYVRRLEEVLIRTCADFHIPAKRISGLTGVWTTADTAAPTTSSVNSEAKIGAIGVHISRAVTSHGFALNVNTDLTYFDLIVPCGITAKPVTSMAREVGKEVLLQETAHAIARNFGTVFQSQILWLDSLEALLGPAIGVPMKVPEPLRQLRNENEKDSFWA
jgi:lipoyl(octanoyl) transferase